MSEDKVQPFYATGPVPLPDPSRYGVRLVPAMGPQGRRYQYVGLDAVGKPLRPDVPADLPGFPESSLLLAASWLRHLWARANACGMWALYLDLRRNEWEMLFPPQVCTPASGRADCSFPEVEKPEAHWRLAGTLRSSPVDDLDQLAAEVTPRDGIHLVLHPQRPWVSITAAFVVSGGKVEMATAAALIAEPRRDFHGLYERTKLADSDSR